MHRSPHGPQPANAFGHGTSTLLRSSKLTHQSSPDTQPLSSAISHLQTRLLRLPPSFSLPSLPFQELQGLDALEAMGKSSRETRLQRKALPRPPIPSSSNDFHRRTIQTAIATHGRLMVRTPSTSYYGVHRDGRGFSSMKRVGQGALSKI